MPVLVDNQPSRRIRIWPLWLMMIVMMVLMTMRLFQLTIVEGKWHRKLAEENRILTLPITAPRGALMDRNGQVLTQNVPVYRRQKPNTGPAALAFETIEREAALKLLADPKERISYGIERKYPCGQACASVVGYVAEAMDEEITTLADYRMGDMVGRVGAEKAFERRLMGKPGEEYVEVNANGMAVRTVGKVESQAGATVKLSLDLGLQQVLYQEMASVSGAVVAMVPQTGEVLALVSSPSFDPNDMAASLAMENQPFFNRALTGAYAPGSTFKIVTATAALEEGKIEANTSFEDTGELVVGDYKFGNWLYEEHGRTEGAVDVVRALARSNDIFFYQVGAAVGVEKMAEWARLFGLGSNWQLADWGAKSGLIPDEAWKLKTKGERWYLGNTYHMAIGQGDVLATPLQVAVMTAGIANRGVICAPQFEAQEGKGNPNCQQLNLSQETVGLVQEGMRQACQPGGTGSPFFNFKLQVGCKTGTAQQGGEKDLPHAWFTMFAPFENPEIVITVLVEKGGQGSTVAAPIAKKGLEYWLQSRDDQSRD